jgi:hypothetical protein
MMEDGVFTGLPTPPYISAILKHQRITITREDHMIEGIAMLTILAGMGFYFVKSTELPKDLKDAPEKSKFAHLTVAKTAEVKKVETIAEVKKEFSILELKALAEKAAAEKVLLEESLRLQKIAKIERLNKEIDELTLAITILEQELTINTKRNAEISTKINTHLARLQVLKDIKIS